jgi:hypothetical protein
MRSLKDTFNNHLLITLIVLVGLLFFLAISSFATDIDVYSNTIVEFFIFNFDDYDSSLSTQLLNSLHLFCNMLIIYPCYPYLFSLRKYYSNRNPRSIINEFDLLVKITIVLFPFFIFGLG